MPNSNPGTGATQGGSLLLGPRTLPPPHGASDVVRESVAASIPADRKHTGPIPETDEEWLVFVAAADEPAIAGARALEEGSP